MAERLRYDDVQAGDELKPWDYQVERVNLVKYAGASGDFNPIHWNPRFATSVGLPDTIATGMYTMARIGRFLSDWCGDPGAVKRFKNRFTGMIVVPDEGATVTVRGRVAEKLDDKHVRVEFEAIAAEQPACKGEAAIELA